MFEKRYDIFLAPCHVIASDNLISDRVYKSGTRADLKCKKGFTLVGMIDGEVPSCLNGTWMIRQGTKFPYCANKADVIKEITYFKKYLFG